MGRQDPRQHLVTLRRRLHALVRQLARAHGEPLLRDLAGPHGGLGQLQVHADAAAVDPLVEIPEIELLAFVVPHRHALVTLAHGNDVLGRVVLELFPLGRVREPGVTPAVFRRLAEQADQARAALALEHLGGKPERLPHHVEVARQAVAVGLHHRVAAAPDRYNLREPGQCVRDHRPVELVTVLEPHKAAGIVDRVEQNRVHVIVGRRHVPHVDRPVVERPAQQHHLGLFGVAEASGCAQVHRTERLGVEEQIRHVAPGKESLRRGSVASPLPKNGLRLSQGRGPQRFCPRAFDRSTSARRSRIARRGGSSRLRLSRWAPTAR